MLKTASTILISEQVKINISELIWKSPFDFSILLFIFQEKEQKYAWNKIE